MTKRSPSYLANRMTDEVDPLALRLALHALEAGKTEYGKYRTLHNEGNDPRFFSMTDITMLARQKIGGPMLYDFDTYQTMHPGATPDQWRQSMHPNPFLPVGAADKREALKNAVDVLLTHECIRAIKSRDMGKGFRYAVTNQGIDLLRELEKRQDTEIDVGNRRVAPEIQRREPEVQGRQSVVRLYFPDDLNRRAVLGVLTMLDKRRATGKDSAIAADDVQKTLRLANITGTFEAVNGTSGIPNRYQCSARLLTQRAFEQLEEDGYIQRFSSGDKAPPRYAITVEGKEYLQTVTAEALLDARVRQRETQIRR